MNEPNHDEAEIARQNRNALIFFIVLAVLGTWATTSYRKYVKLEECVEAGHRNCEPLEVEEK